MEIKEMLQSILDKLSNSLNSTILFGEPREIHNKTFIPVTAVSFGFGFGSGSGSGMKQGKKKSKKHTPEVMAQDSPMADAGNEEAKKQNPGNSGVGGGGGGKAIPLGIFEISEEHTRFIPVISAKHIMIMIGMMMLMMHKMCHKKCHKQD